MTAAGGQKGKETRLDFVIGIANMTWPGIAAVQSGFANLTAAGMRTTNVLNNSMLALEAGMLAAGGAAALALGLMTYEAAKFEKQMKMVQSLITNINDSPMTIQTKMAELTKSAKQMAIEFGTSPIKIAEGFAVLGRAGIETANDMNTVMRASIQLAKIEGISVSDAATMTVQMTTLFGGDMARDAEKFAEILAHAANVSTTSAKEIMTGMGYAGGIAATIWGGDTSEEKYRNASDMAAMIATLSQQGVSGPMAGTAIKSFMNYMVKDMPKSKKALRQLGLDADDFRDAEGNFLRYDEMIDKLQNKFNQKLAPGGGWKSQGDIYKWFVKWGEPRQAQQYMKMFRTTTDPETGDKVHMYDIYLDKMKEEYSMQEKINTVMSSASEKWNKVVSAISVFAINVGEKFLPILSAVADILTLITSSAAASEILAWVAAIGLAILVGLGLLAVIRWLTPAYRDLRNMTSLLAHGKWKEAMGWGGATAAIEADTVATKANTKAKVENAVASGAAGGGVVGGAAGKGGAKTPGVVTTPASKDVAERTARSKAAGAKGVPPIVPVGGPKDTQTTFTSGQRAVQKDTLAKAALIAKQEQQIAAATNAALIASAFKTRGASTLGGKTPEEFLRAMKGVDVKKAASWEKAGLGFTESTYLARMSRGIGPTPEMAAKLGKSTQWLDMLLAGTMVASMKGKGTQATDKFLKQFADDGKKIEATAKKRASIKLPSGTKQMTLFGDVATTNLAATQAAEKRALAVAGKETPLMRRVAGELIATGGLIAASSKRGIAKIISTLGTGGLVAAGAAVVAAGAGLAVWNYGSDRSRQWWTPDAELREKTEKDQKRHLRWISAQYNGLRTQEQNLILLKKRGLATEEQIQAVRARASYYGGDKGEGGLYGETKAAFDEQNKYTDTLTNKLKYSRSLSETLSQQLAGPPATPTNIPGYVAPATMPIGPEQTILNKRMRERLYGTIGQPETAYTGNVKALQWMGERDYSGLLPAGTDAKARGEFLGTALGTRYMNQFLAATDEQRLYEEEREKGGLDWALAGFKYPMAATGYGVKQATWELESNRKHYQDWSTRRARGETSPEEDAQMLSYLQDQGPTSMGEAWESGMFSDVLLSGGIFNLESWGMNMNPEQREKWKMYKAGKGIMQTTNQIGQQSNVNIKQLNVYAPGGSAEETTPAVINGIKQSTQG